MVICRQSHHCQRTDPQCHHLWSSGVVGCWSGVPDNEGEAKGMGWCSKEAWDWRFMNRQIGHILPVKGNADTFSPTSFNVIDFLCKKKRPKNSTGGFRLSTVRSCPSLPTWWSTIRPFDHQSSRAARQSWPINSQLICGIRVVQPWLCVYV